MPLRRKLVVTAVMMLLLGLVSVSTATFGIIRWFAEDSTKQQLTADIEGLRQVIGTPTARSVETQEDWLRELSRNEAIPPMVQIRNGEGELLFDTTPAGMRLPAGIGESKPDRTRFQNLESPGSDWQLSISPLGDDGTLVMGLPRAATHAALTQLALYEAGISVVVLGLIAWLGGTLIRRDLRPLERMAGTAREIADGDLSRRVSPTESTTEVGRLGAALNVMLEEIEHATRERTRSERQLRHFIADASHELRTPVASIRGYAELFRHGAADNPDDLARALRRIESEAERMGVIVDEMLLLARLDQGRPLDRAAVDIALLAADALADARAVEPDRPLQLVSDGPAEVDGDAGRLRQVLANLLANVRQHTPPGTPATLRITDGTDDTDDVVIEVSDEGPGLTPEQSERVFERFYRSSSTGTPGRGGAGLGLAIVAAVAEAHGGSASTRTRPGAGAVFVVRIPKTGADPA